MKLALPAGPLAALAVAALLAGCGGPSRPKAAPSPTSPASKPAATPARAGDATAIESLLRRRAQALEAGNAKAYAATSTGPQRLRDREAARNAAPLRLRDVALAVDSVDVSGRRARLKVRSIYSVRGVRGRFAAARILTAARTGRGWRIRSESSRRARHPWEVGPVAEHRSRHFVVIAPRGLDLAAAGLTEALETGYARMGDVLRRPRLRRRYLVVVAGEARAARSLTQRISGVEGLAAISDSEVRESGPAQRVTEVPSQRLVVVWPPFAALDAEGRLRVVTHELTHAGLAGVTSGRTPAWLLEGMALYVSEDRRAGQAAELVASATSPAARRALTLKGLSRPDVIARQHGAGQEAAYAYASAAAFYIVARFGRKRYLELYDAFNDEALPGRAGPALAARAVQHTLGVSFGRLERDLRRWIRTQSL
ncbi:MAG: hypothetical protein ABI611_02575 [Solirubrobacteraceae bacterium]